MKEMLGGACPISNIRALNEALVQNPKAELIITVEGAVESTTNAHQLFASRLLQFHLIPGLQECMFISLTFANWHAGHVTKVPNTGKEVKHSRSGSYLKLVTSPMTRMHSGKYRRDFVGQGARAVAFRKISRHL